MHCPKQSELPCRTGSGQWWEGVSYLHDGTELGFILHLLLCHSPLDTGQHTGFEEVPPVVVQDPEEQLEELCFHIRG